MGTLCSTLVFLPNKPWTLELAIASFCPLFVWIAARVRPAFTAVATFMCAITIVWTTIFGVGLFGDSRVPLEERVLSAQATILATSFGALVLAALFSERRTHELALLERELRLEEALRAGGVKHVYEVSLREPSPADARLARFAEKIAALLDVWTQDAVEIRMASSAQVL